MKHAQLRSLRQELKPFSVPNTLLGLGIFALDMTVYGAAIAGVLFFEPLWAKILCSLVAGAVISLLFVVGHDAAHQSFVKPKWLNKIIALIVFMPSLHNYKLWDYEHHKLHHSFTNFQGRNSWSPFSKEEFDRLPLWRQLLERKYRTLTGLGLYYMIERWWKHKFYPNAHIPQRLHAESWRYFALNMVYLTAFLTFLVWSPNIAPVSALEAVILGFVVPFYLWNVLMGKTVYIQHTHENIPWFRNPEDWSRLSGQEDVTPHIQFPKLYNIISHNIMEHTAHHIDTRIPLYNLSAAQKKLDELIAPPLIVENFSVGRFFETMRKCKLYDYENHRWLDFNGNPTTGTTLKPHHFEAVSYVAPEAANIDTQAKPAATTAA